MTEIIEAVFIGLAARHHRNEESFYHSVLYGYCRNFSSLVLTEAPGSIGTPDTFILLDNGTYVVIELKYGGDAAASSRKSNLKKLALKAISAIDSKSYLSAYMARAKQKIFKIGLGVSFKGKCLAIVEEFDRKQSQ
jgi:hypothetical protein